MPDFGPWLPDQPAFQGPHLRDARGCIARAKSYSPLPSLASLSDALSERPTGACAARDNTATVHVYAGSETKLQELNSSGAWTDRSKLGGYTGTDTTRWRFATFGDRLIATNLSDAIQYIDMSTGSAFADLPGGPPEAKFAASYAGFLFIAYTSDSVFQLKWSALNDSEEWTPGTDQSDEIEFPDGGIITGLFAADALYIFQERCIRRLIHVGPPLVMDIQVIERDRGCVESESLATLGRKAFYLAEDGSYAFQDGNSEPIGAEAWDDWFNADADRGLFYRMSAAIDPVRKVMMRSYVSVNSPDGNPDSVLIYNWVVGRATYARVETEALFPALSLGYTLEDLDTLYASIDDMTISLDDAIWTGGALRFGAFNSDWEFGRFAGSNLEAVFEPGNTQFAPGARALVRSVRPITDASGATVSLAATETEADSFTYTGGEAARETSGRCCVRDSGRYFRARVTIPAAATWTHAQGVEDFEFRLAGRR